jgi:hypothetical protein
MSEVMSSVQGLTRFLAGALVAVVVWELPGAAHADDDGKSSTVVVRAVMVFDSFVAPVLEVGANFTSVGRVVWASGRPFDGRVAFACQITDLDAGAGACLYYFHLPGGQVTGTGDVRDGIEFPITGGTGRYVGVSGTVLITEQEDGSRFAVFRLSKAAQRR